MDFFKFKPLNPFPPTNMRYVPPCESNEFNEQGTPIGYYVDGFGNKVYRNNQSESKNDTWWDGIFQHMHDANNDGEVIDITFKEVKEDEVN